MVYMYHSFLVLNLFLTVLGLCCCTGFSLVAESRDDGSFHTQPSHCRDFSYCGDQTLGARALVVAACGFSRCDSLVLEHRLGSCGTQA